jgi:hypothetical protein
MGWSAAAALVGCVVALALCTSATGLFFERRSRLRGLAGAKAEFWALEMREERPGGVYLLELTPRDAIETELCLRSLSVSGRGNLKIAACPISASGRHALARDQAYSRYLHTEAYFSHDRPSPSGRPSAQLRHAGVLFYLKVPPRPWYLWAGAARLSITLNLQESTPHGLAVKIKLKSGPIPWAVSCQTASREAPVSRANDGCKEFR